MFHPRTVNRLQPKNMSLNCFFLYNFLANIDLCGRNKQFRQPLNMSDTNVQCFPVIGQVAIQTLEALQCRKLIAFIAFPRTYCIRFHRRF